MLVDDVRTKQFYDIYMPGLFIRGKFDLIPDQIPSTITKYGNIYCKCYPLPLGKGFEQNSSPQLLTNIYNKGCCLFITLRSPN
jgi:hypothetical protein